MSEASTIFLAGGGTGGHLYPGIAVAEALRRVRPQSRAVFLCTEKEIDRVILQAAGFEFVPQPIVPPARSVGGLLKFWKSWRETKDLVRQRLREDKPAAVLGLGGYAAGVAVKTAALRKIPTAIINPDVIPGKANQYLMRYTRRVCCQFEQTRRLCQPRVSPEARDHRMPDPNRHSCASARAEAAPRLGLDPKLNTLAITGASLGAKPSMKRSWPWSRTSSCKAGRFCTWPAGSTR